MAIVAKEEVKEQGPAAPKRSQYGPKYKAIRSQTTSIVWIGGKDLCEPKYQANRSQFPSIFSVSDKNQYGPKEKKIHS